LQCTYGSNALLKLTLDGILGQACPFRFREYTQIMWPTLLGCKNVGLAVRRSIGQKRAIDSSIDGDASSGRGSLDLCYWFSRADGIVTGRPEFEIESTFVGFAVGRDRIRFVHGEDA